LRRGEFPPFRLLHDAPRPAVQINISADKGIQILRGLRRAAT
jgi:hypothetical protein